MGGQGKRSSQAASGAETGRSESTGWSVNCHGLLTRQWLKTVTLRCVVPARTVSPSRSGCEGSRSEQVYKLDFVLACIVDFSNIAKTKNQNWRGIVG
jgi:hypothetical protein